MTNYFSKNLKYLREKKNIDQQDIADKLNVPRSTYSCWENGLRTPKVEQIQDIANYFNVDMDIISRDYSNTPERILSKTDILYSKTKDILSDDDRATLEFIMQKTIDNYEKSKNNNIE